MAANRAANMAAIKNDSSAKPIKNEPKSPESSRGFPPAVLRSVLSTYEKKNAEVYSAYARLPSWRYQKVKISGGVPENSFCSACTRPAFTYVCARPAWINPYVRAKCSET